MTLRPLTCHFQYNNRFVTDTPKVYGEILYIFEQNKKLDGSPYWLYIKDQKAALNFYIETSILAIKNATLLNSKLPIFSWVHPPTCPEYQTHKKVDMHIFLQFL